MSLLATVYFLLIVAAKAAVPMWPSCGDGLVTNFNLPSTGGAFAAIGCQFPPTVTTVSFGNMSASSNASVSLIGGFVKAGSAAGISVACPLAAISQLLGPLSISIADMTFGQDAAFRFTGALPPFSALLICNNSFHLTKRNVFSHVNPDTSNFAIASIVIGGNFSSPISLDSNSTIEVKNNTIVGKIAATVDWLIAVSVVGTALTISNSSKMDLSGNVVKDSTSSSNIYVVYVNLFTLNLPSSLVLSDRSHLDLSYNVLSGSVCILAYAANVNLNSPRQNSISIWRTSTLAMDGNELRSSIFSSSYVVSFTVRNHEGTIPALDLVSGSLSVRSNRMLNTSERGTTYVSYIQIYCMNSLSATGAAISMSNLSAVDISGNSISNCTLINTYVAYVYISNKDGIPGAPTVTLQLSRLYMSENSLSITSTGSAYASYANIEGNSGIYVNISNNSIFAMSSNIIAGCSTNAAYVSQLRVSPSLGASVLNLTHNSSFVLNGNTLSNCTSGSVFVATLLLIGSGASLLGDQSIIVISENVMKSIVTRSAMVIYILVGTRVFLSRSNMTLRNNRIHVSVISETSAYVVNLYVANYLILEPGSVLLIGGNAISNSTISNTAYVVFAIIDSSEGGASLLLKSNSVIAVSSNVMYGCSAEKLCLMFVSVSSDGPSLLYLGGGALFTICENELINCSATTVEPYTISAKNITLEGSSISFSSNLCYIPQGTFTTPIVLFVDGSNHQLYQISAGSIFSIDGNEVFGDANLLTVGLATLIESEGLIEIRNNTINGSANILINLGGGLHIEEGKLRVTNNNIISRNKIQKFSLVRASSFIKSSMASVNACDNHLSWSPRGSTFEPNLYLSPIIMAVSAGRCATPTPTPTPAPTFSASHAYVIQTLSKALSRSITLSNTNLSHRKQTVTNNVSRPVTISVTNTAASISRSRSMPVFEKAKPPPSPVPVVIATAAKVKDAAGIAVAVTAVASVTGGQLGVANAMLRLATCTDDDDSSLPILVHPLQFTFGDEKYQKNAAGALSDTLLLPLIVAVIAIGPARLIIMWARSVPSRVAMSQMGWPSLLVLPFANLAEGIGMTTVAALSSGEPFGVGIGLVSCALVLTFAGSWVWILARVIPRSRLELRQEEHSTSGKRRQFLAKMVRPTHRWVPLPKAEGRQTLAPRFVERYSNAVGDKQWYYAELLSFFCSLLVGVAEGLPSSICRARVLIAMIPALLQCVLAVLALVPLERFLQSLLALCLVPMYVVVAVKVFNDSESESLDSVMAVFSSAGNGIGIGIMALSLAMGIWEIVTSHRVINDSRFRRRIANGPLSDRQRLDLPMLSLDETDLADEAVTPLEHETDVGLGVGESDDNAAQLSSPTPSLSAAEHQVVQSIVSQLRTYEADQSQKTTH